MVISANRWLSASEQEINAKYIWNKLKGYGWSEQAIAGVLGNMQIESTINPGIWEGLNAGNTSRGFGMVQYTPGSMVINHAAQLGVNPGDMDFQLDLLNTDYFRHWIATSGYNLSYTSFKTSTQSPEWLAQAFLKNFERPANQNQPDRSTHARRWYDQLKGGGGTMTNIQLALNWMHKKDAAGITYSMASRMGPRSYDCSSAVFFALQHAGFKVPYIGNTETLFQLRGTLLTPINRSQIRAGDVFVSGVPGGSSNAYGHTGFALNATQAIHCSSTFNGIGISSNADTSVRAYSGAPVYWFRVIGSTLPSDPAPAPDPGTPTPTPSPTPEASKDIFITKVNGGKEYIEQKQLVELFGKRFVTVHFQEIESDKDLLQKGKDYLNNQPLELQELRLTFAQLHKYNVNYKELKKGDIITVRIDDLKINQRMRVKHLEVDLSDDDTGMVVLGRPSKALTGWMAKPQKLVNFSNLAGR